jgi:threonine dehydrogenase-like Zn-dependent dehydrogenase
MKAAIFQGKGKIEVQEVPDPKINGSDQAIVRVTYACICGSDLWYYRGISDKEKDSRIGHEFMGVVEEVGNNVQNMKVGDLVIAPFFISDGTCPECKAGETKFCRNGFFWGQGGSDGGQGEKVKVPLADGTLVVVPNGKGLDEKMLRALLPLTDVMSTGHHAALDAHVGEGSTVAVIGDGAVGLCAVAASKRFGASRIFLVSTHEDRAKIGKKFGATDIIDVRGEEGIKKIRQATSDLGVDCALECVGNPDAWELAWGVVRPGGNIGFVGVPQDVPDMTVSKLFSSNVGVKGSGANSRAYIPELMKDVLSGKLDVSAVFTKDVRLDDIAEGYRDMDERREIKILVKP